MEQRESSSILGAKKLPTRLVTASLAAILVVLPAATASAQEFDSITYDLDVSSKGAVELEATFHIAEEGNSSQHSMAVSGASSLPVVKQEKDGDHQYSVVVTGESAQEFADAYQAWAGTVPSVEVALSGGDFFAEYRTVHGTLPAPSFVEGNPPVTTLVAVTSGSRAIPGTAITAGSTKISGVNMKIQSNFPVEFQTEFTKATTKGIALNMLGAGLVLGILVYGVRALLKNWDRSARKQRKEARKNS